MTSGNTFLRRLTEIDDLGRPDHSYLRPEDHCYFLGEYTARKGFAFSVTNQLVSNFKKSMDKRGTAGQTSAGSFTALAHNTQSIEFGLEQRDRAQFSIAPEDQPDG